MHRVDGFLWVSSDTVGNKTSRTPYPSMELVLTASCQLRRRRGTVKLQPHYASFILQRKNTLRCLFLIIVEVFFASNFTASNFHISFVARE